MHGFETTMNKSVTIFMVLSLNEPFHLQQIVADLLVLLHQKRS
jgi:hypothetical protein